MAQHPRLRSLLALAITGVLALLLRTPLCSPKVCSMSRAKMAACEALGGDCCQGASARAAHTSVPVQVQAPPPSLVFLAVEEASASPAQERSLREPLAAAAILQGVGLHTLLAVFLI